MLGMVSVSFVSGIFGMIFEQIYWILALHKVISIALGCFLAIHIYVFGRKMGRRREKARSSI